MNRNWSGRSFSSNQILFDEAIVKCTQILQSQLDMKQSIQGLLEVLGDFYQAESCCVFQFDEGTQLFHKEFQWKKQGGNSAIIQFKELPFAALEYFEYDQSVEQELSFLSFDTTAYPELPISQLFLQVGIQNVRIYPMIQGGQTTGLVGITNLNTEEFDNRLFHCTTLFVQECLQKQVIHSQLVEYHNIDPLTECFNAAQYAIKLKQLEQNPPAQLGIVFAKMTGLEKTAEIYGQKFVDLKVKNAADVMNLFIDFPFYRLEENKFVCFASDVGEASFLSMVEQLRKETVSNSDACFTVGHTWSSGTVDVFQEISRCNTGLFVGMDSVQNAYPKKFLSSTECLQNDLLRGIAQDDFVVYLQSKVVLATDKVVGAEALVRRLIPRSQILVKPDTFVPLYENHGIIRDLDLHVFDKVCGMLSNWGKSGVQIPISVNFSRVTLMEAGIALAIADICKKHKVPPHLVELEITERLGSSPDDLTNLVVEDFKKLGLNLVLDDFGSTYSNFLTLAKVDINEVKIDHSLVENMEDSEKNQKILKSIITMCEALGGTASLAEGIETERQKEILLGMNCTYGQGFFFSQPLPIEEFYQKFLVE